MFDFQKELELTQKATEIFEKLQQENSMCQIGDIVDSLDETMAKRVLKMFVYSK